MKINKFRGLGQNYAVFQLNENSKGVSSSKHFTGHILAKVLAEQDEME